MPRGYWRFLDAAVIGLVAVWLVLAAVAELNPPAQREPDGKSYEQHYVSRPGPLYYAPHPSYDDTRCYQDQSRDNADLCAQWRAAIAAEKAAQAAVSASRSGWIAVFLTFAGTVLIIGTLHITRDTARKQLRAYVGIDSAGITPFRPVGGDDANRRVALSIKNFGQTPAMLIRATLQVAVDGANVPPPSFKPRVALAKTRIEPGHEANIAFEFSMTDEMHQAVEFSIFTVMAFGEIVTRDIYGDETTLPYSYYSLGATYRDKQMREGVPPVAT